MLSFAVSLAFVLAPPADDAASRQDLVTRSLVGSTRVKGARATLEDRMKRWCVPGCAIAVVRDFEIDWVAGFGVRDAQTGAPVTPQTMFQAGSISKPVFATAVHRLIQDETIALDADVRTYLKSWKLPENEFSKAHPLTIESLLAHTGSVTVHGFFGYSLADAVPTVPQILSGTPPSNSPPVIMDGAPGAFRYAGGGTTMLQLAVGDATGKAIPALLDELVFRPLDLTHSTYLQPLPVESFPDSCAGHLEDGGVTYGRFQTHPELGAAGLWISARDLANLLREWMLAANGKSERVLSTETMTRMLKPVGAGPTTAGFFLENRAGTTYFQHGGSNVGFKNVFYGCVETGNGLVYLSNGDGGQNLMSEVVGAITEVYGWKGFAAAETNELAPDESELTTLPGRYELGDDLVAEVLRDGDRLTVRLPPSPATPLYRVGERTYLCLDPGSQMPGDSMRLEFEEPEDGVCEGLDYQSGPKRDYALRAEDDDRSTSELAAAGAVPAALERLREQYTADSGTARAQLEAKIDRLVGHALICGDLRFARAAAELLVELYPESAYAHATLGRVAFRTGDTPTLIAACKAVVKIGATLGEGMGGYTVSAAKTALLEFDSSGR